MTVYRLEADGTLIDTDTMEPLATSAVGHPAVTPPAPPVEPLAPWIGQHWQFASRSTRPVVKVCCACACVVGDETGHRQWHRYIGYALVPAAGPPPAGGTGHVGIPTFLAELTACPLDGHPIPCVNHDVELFHPWG